MGSPLEVFVTSGGLQRQPLRNSGLDRESVNAAAQLISEDVIYEPVLGDAA
jgi:hypothetical protein